MYEVTVKIGGNASKYWASLEFDDAKGKTHRKEIARERAPRNQAIRCRR